MKIFIYNIKQFFFKNTLFQILMFSGIVLATIITTYGIYQNTRQLVDDLPKVTLLGCLFDVMH